MRGSACRVRRWFGCLAAAACNVPFFVPPALAQAPAAKAELPARVVIVRITVVTTASEPLAGVPVRASISDATHAYGRTDEAGRAAIPISMGAEVGEVTVAVAPNLDAPALQRVEEYERAISAYNFPFETRAPVPVAATEASVQITARPALTLAGRVVNGDGHPIRAIVISNGPYWPGQTGENGRFEIGGVPATERSELFVLADSTPTLSVIHRVPVSPPVQGNDLGEIVIKHPLPESIVTVLATSGEKWLPSGSVGSAVLVSESGSTVLAIQLWGGNPADDHPGVAAEVRQRNTHELPPGTYYMSPGYFVGTKARHLKLIAMARAKADLASTSIPRLTVAPGQVTEFKFDLAAAIAAIEAAPFAPQAK